MTTSYFLRLLFLACAAFFLLRLAAEAFAALIADAAIRRAEKMRPDAGARLVLTLRLLPAFLSLLLVAMFCIPSYLRFEPPTAREEIGVLCLSTAVLGLALLCVALWRSARAWIRTARYTLSDDGGIALAGIVRPRVLISARARRELSEAQLDAALLHEHAHRESLDNLKRLLMLLAPAMLPGSRGLERTWARCAEWAADEQAAGGDPSRALALAEALVRVARMQTEAPSLVATLINSDEDLSVRVDRLLNVGAPVEEHLGGAAIAACAAALAIALAAVNPTALHAVHGLLERLLD
ncbi:MAG TPA: hypothetical protein VMT15_10985 [Bryobacteraceae bacterium]|nr:hypothetical protein [Bryobacteraceae bacterium]